MDLVASDPDSNQRLTFSLDSALMGMSVDPSSGRILWTPLVSQLGAQGVIVRVTDDGTPPLEGRGEFVVTVSSVTPAEVRITDVEVAGAGELRITYYFTWHALCPAAHRPAPRIGLEPVGRIPGGLRLLPGRDGGRPGPGAAARFFRVVRLD